jgi:hypothetical protein
MIAMNLLNVSIHDQLESNYFRCVFIYSRLRQRAVVLLLFSCHVQANNEQVLNEIRIFQAMKANWLDLVRQTR